MSISRPLVRALIVLGLIGLVTTIVSFLLNSGSNENWWSGLLINFGTSMFGSVITFIFLDLILQAIEERQSRKEKQTQLSIALHNQFQSMETIRARQVTRRILLENFEDGEQLNSKQLYQKLYFDTHREEDWLSVSRIIHSYEEIGELLEQDALNEDLIRIFFYSYLKEMYDDEYFGEFVSLSIKTNWAKYVDHLAKKLNIEKPARKIPSKQKGGVETKPKKPIVRSREKGKKKN
jgi:hypothetical protein